MPTKYPLVEGKTTLKQIALFPKTCPLQMRNLEADKCTRAFQHMQSTLTDGLRNTDRFPVIPVVFMESVTWAGAEITIELNLGN